MYRKNGLLYWILDDRGNKIGVPIKASALVSRLTMKNLQSKFQANEQLRPVYTERLTNVIDSFFHDTDRHTRADFCDYLSSYGINPVFRENVGGRVYGITFIDNTKGAVINGSDLGKGYSGQALVKRFNSPITPDGHLEGRAAGERERQERVGQGHEWRQFLHLMNAEKYSSDPINQYLKRKKKKRGKSI